MDIFFCQEEHNILFYNNYSLDITSKEMVGFASYFLIIFNMYLSSAGIVNKFRHNAKKKLFINWSKFNI